jgi:hypothetical protein
LAAALGAVARCGLGAALTKRLRSALIAIREARPLSGCGELDRFLPAADSDRDRVAKLLGSVD